LSVKLPTVLKTLEVRLVMADTPKDAIPVGTVAGVQFDAVLKSLEPGFALHIASPADAPAGRKQRPASKAASHFRSPL
jgi:hypothetical protein